MADPFSALISLTGGGGLSAGGGGPSSAGGGTNNSGFDSSGWAVNFGAGNANATPSADGLGQWTPYILAGLGLLIAWRMTRKR